MRTALLLGASGLVGSELLERIALDTTYERVTALVRRPLPEQRAKVAQVLVDYERPDTYLSHLGVDDVFCCLGTTIKQAGSQAAFRRVDFELPLTLAKHSLAAGAKRYLVVTAVGSNANSATFYSRVKGELENELEKLAFPEGIKIFRPSLLIGERAEPRFGEKLASLIMGAAKPLLTGGLMRFRAISGAEVASAMLNAAKIQDASLKVYQGAELFALAKG